MAAPPPGYGELLEHGRTLVPCRLGGMGPRFFFLGGGNPFGGFQGKPTTENCAFLGTLVFKEAKGKILLGLQENAASPGFGEGLFVSFGGLSN